MHLRMSQEPPLFQYSHIRRYYDIVSNEQEQPLLRTFLRRLLMTPSLDKDKVDAVFSGILNGDLVLPSPISVRDSDIPYEPYFTETDLLIPLSDLVDKDGADRLRELGAVGLAEQVGDVRRVEIADMANRFISEGSEKYKAFLRGIPDALYREHLTDFKVMDAATEEPRKRFHGDLELIVKSELFTSVEFLVVYRTRDGSSYPAGRSFVLDYPEKTTREYAMFGVGKHGQRYLLIRWGTEMPEMATLVNAHNEREAQKLKNELAQASKVDRKEELIRLYQTRVPDTLHQLKKPTLSGTGIVAAGVVGVIFLSTMMWIVLGVGILTIMAGVARSGIYLLKHDRPNTVRKIYGGRDSLDRFMLAKGEDYVFRNDANGHIKIVKIDKRLVKK